MKIAQIHPAKLVKQFPFWLAIISGALVAIYITLLYKGNDTAQLGMSALFLLAVISLLWDNRHSFQFRGSLFARTVGVLILLFTLGNSVLAVQEISQNEGLVEIPFLRVYPFLAAIGISLLASGFKGLKQYWKPIVVLFALGTPYFILSSFVDLSPITAGFSTFLLWYSGFEAIREGVHIVLPTGAVWVNHECSGMETTTYVLGLSMVAIVMFPLTRIHQIFAVLGAMLIGFLVNSIRVSIMAVLVAWNHMETFQDWHEGESSRTFGMAAVFTFGLFYYFLMQREEQVKSNENKEDESLHSLMSWHK